MSTHGPIPRALGIALVILLGAASLASAADHPKRPRPRGAGAWSGGFAVGSAWSGMIQNLEDELKRQGWADATRDTFAYGLFLPGSGYPYSFDDHAGGARLWAARAFNTRYALRGELSQIDYGDVHGHQDGSGFVTMDLSTYSFALMMMYGRRFKVGGGPSWDVTANTVNFDYDHKDLIAGPGLTLLAQFAVYRHWLGQVVVMGVQHFGINRTLGPYSGSQGGSFSTTLNTTCTWVGLAYETSTAADR